MTKPTEVETVLEELIDLCYGNIWWSYQNKKKNPAIKKAIAALDKYYGKKILEMIGKDETPPKGVRHYPGAIDIIDGVIYPASSEEMLYHPETYAKNQLKAELRAAIIKEFKLEDAG